MHTVYQLSTLKHITFLILILWYLIFEGNCNLNILMMYKGSYKKFLYKSINNYLTTNEICIFFAAGNLCLLVTHDNMMCMNCELFMTISLVNLNMECKIHFAYLIDILHTTI